MGIEDIVTEINRLMVENWPERPVYRGFMKNDFDRPSFFLDVKKTTIEPMNAHLVHENHVIMAVIYETVDESGAADSRCLLETRERFQRLFSGGKLKVGDRYLNVSVSGPTVDIDSALVDLTVDYYRPRAEGQAETPTISSVETKIEMEA